MKKFIYLFLAVFIFIRIVTAETYEPGSSFRPYSPTGLDEVTPVSNEYHSVFPTVSAIKPTTNDEEYEFQITMINSDAGNANWCFPVVVTYIVKQGTKITLHKWDFLHNPILTTLDVIDVKANYIELVEEKASELLKSENE